MFARTVFVSIIYCVYYVVSQNTSHISLGLTGFYTRRGPPFQIYRLGSAIHIALDKIRSNESVLSNTSIDFIFDDSDCNEKKAIDSVVTLVRDHGVDTIIGPACSSSAKGVGKLAAQWNVPVVAYGGSSVDLSDKSFYTSYSRTIPLTSEFGSVLAGLAEANGWKRLCVEATEFETHYYHVVDGLEIYLPKVNATFVKPIFTFDHGNHSESLIEMQSQCRGKS